MNKKVICLLSDGLDSPVATFLLEQKSLEVIGLNYINHPYVGPILRSKKQKEQAEETKIENNIDNIAQALINSFKFQTEFTLYQIPHGLDLKKIIEAAPDPKYTCILCKRLMFKKAEYLAYKLDINLLATGDILGEQASQTIENLKIIQESLQEKSIIRPNIGLNKQEVTNIARRIGTYQYSEAAAKFTCTAVPKKPATKAPLEIIEAIEEKIDIEKLIQESWEKRIKKTFHKKRS